MSGSQSTPISRWHLLGATVWGYGAGAVRVVPWTRREHFDQFGGGSCA